MTDAIIAGPLRRKASWRAAGTSGPTTAARYCAAFAGVSGTPAASSTGLFGIQMPAPERAAEPPKVGAFSTTTTLSPRFAAVSAAVIPAAPEPTTTTSYSPSSGAAPAAGAAASPDVTARPTPAAVPRRIWRRVRSVSMAHSSLAERRRSSCRHRRKTETCSTRLEQPRPVTFGRWRQPRTTFGAPQPQVDGSLILWIT